MLVCIVILVIYVNIETDKNIMLNVRVAGDHLYGNMGDLGLN